MRKILLGQLDDTYSKKSEEFMTDLPIPEGAVSASSASEVARVWVADGQMYVSLNPNVWDDPAAWGILLVDLARHVANAYSQTTEQDAHAVLSRVREGLDAEWESPTDYPSGGLLE